MKVKVKRGGGAAGHNGICSMIAHIGDDFRRVRIGIGHPGHKARVTGHVLGSYHKSEIEPLTDLLGAIAAEVPWLAEGDAARFVSDLALRLNGCTERGRHKSHSLPSSSRRNRAIDVPPASANRLRDCGGVLPIAAKPTAKRGTACHI